MDSSINNLNFDSDGICEYCKNVKLSETINFKKSLDKYINLIKNNHKKISSNTWLKWRC